MSYRDCLACKEAGTKPKRGQGITIVYDPGIQIPGTPTVQGHRISAEQVAGGAYRQGITEEMGDYDLTREEVLAACWWAGLFGPRRLRKVFEAWAVQAGHHLWYQCIQIPDPPRKPEP